MSNRTLSLRGCTRLVAAALLFGAVPAAAHAQAELAVTAAGAGTLRVAPSQRASAPFRVVAGGPAGAVRIVIDVPAGWRAIAPPDLQLPRDANVLRVISFFVPAAARAGTYTIRLEAQTPAGRTAADSVRVEVGEHAALDVVVEHAPSWAAPEDTIAVGFRVSNPGNTDLSVELRLNASPGLRVRAPTAARRLAPGESFLFEAEATTLGSHNGQAHVLRLTAGADSVTATAVARIELVDRGVMNGARAGHSLPAEVRLRLTDDEQVRPSVRIAAAGPLRAGSSTRAELLLQGPYTRYSTFGEQDIYRFALQSRALSLKVGDQVFGLSPLTEPGRAGLGAGGSLRVGAVEAGGFMQRDRRSPLRTEQHGAFARAAFGTAANVGVNWLHHESGYAAARDVVSTQLRLRAPGNWLTADAEYGRRLDLPADALSIYVRGARGPLSVQLRHLRTDSAYGGSWGGTSVDAAQLSLRPRGRLLLEASAEERSSQRVLVGFPLSESVRTGRLAAGYGAALGEARYYSVARSTAWSESERTVHSLAFRLRLPAGAVSLTPRVEGGRSSDGLTGGTATFWRGSAQASLATSSGSYAASFEYFSAGSVHTAASPAGMNASLSASLRPSDLTRLTVTASGVRYTDATSYGSLLADALLERELPFGHLLGLRVARREIAGMFDRRETLVMLDYTIPLRVPLGGRAATGAVGGRLYDLESGAPLSQVIVEIGGRRAATDENGRFEVRGLAAGPHRVRIDRGAAGTHRVPAEELPPRIDVQARGTAALDIAMVTAARIDGSIVIVRQTAAAAAAAGAVAARGPTGPASDSLDAESAGGMPARAAAEPLAGAVIELARGTERVRRTADERGGFTISDLRPGVWAVTVIGARLPQHYRFERDTIVVVMTPGARSAVEFRAVAAERRVQMVGTTTISDVTAAAPAAARRPVPQAPQPDAGATAARQPTAAPQRQETATSTSRQPTSAAPPQATAPQQSAPAPQRPAPAAARPAETALPRGWTLYTVPGFVTSLAGVARDAYLETGLWPKIWLANRAAVPDPDRLRPGMVLRLPPRSALTAAEERALYDHMTGGW